MPGRLGSSSASVARRTGVEATGPDQLRDGVRQVPGHVLTRREPLPQVAGGDREGLELEERDPVAVPERLQDVLEPFRRKPGPGRDRHAGQSQHFLQSGKSQNSSAPIKKTGSRHSG